MNYAEKEMATFFEPGQFLHAADVVLCSYPMVICLALHAVLGDTPMIQTADMLFEYVKNEYQPTLLERYREMVDHPYRTFAEWGTRFGAVIHSVQFDLRFENVPFTAQYVYKYIGVNPRDAPRALPMIGGSDNDSGVATGPPRFAVMLWRIHALLGAEASVVHWLVNVIKEYPIQRAHVDIVTANHRFQYNAIEDYFSAIIMFPWTWDTVSFAEFYALGTPMFIPSKRFMVPIITSLCITSSQFRFLDTRPYYAVNRTDCSWTSVSPEEERRLGLRPGTSLPRCAGLTEGNRIFQCNAEEFGAWWDQTNYATRPHVQRFDSLNHLLSLFDSFDGSRVLFESIAENMWEDRQGALDFARDWLKKKFIKKFFGYLARCDFWLKSSSKFWIL